MLPIRIGVLAAVCAFAWGTLGFDDETDELNWDVLGGTVSGYEHFRKHCADHPDFVRRLLQEPALDAAPREFSTVWIAPEAFRKAKLMQWGIGEVQGEPCLTSHGGHHGLRARIGFDVPRSGDYRLWVKYWHDRGTAASFRIELGEGRLAEIADPARGHVGDVFGHDFDFAEFARRANPLPDHRSEPSGFIWESTGRIPLSAGRYSLAVSGLTHEGQYASRKIAAIVITDDPAAEPPKHPRRQGAIVVERRVPSEKFAADREIWRRRPRVVEGAPALKRLWREWREAFFDDLSAGRVGGVEAGRMAGRAYFDEASNLVGTPRQVREERAAMKQRLANLDRRHFKRKLEAENFKMGKEGWYVEGSSGASGGKQLVTGYWGGECDASGETELPKPGVYAVWLRYMEVGGYLAKYYFRIEDAAGRVLVEKELANDAEYNRRHGGWSWLRFEVDFPSPKARVRLVKRDAGLTYRRVDAVIVTDDLEYRPEGEGLVVPPLDRTKPLTVWCPRDCWLGFSRLSAPDDGDDLAPHSVKLREGECESLLLLVRNNTDQTHVATPKLRGDAARLVRWRVPGFLYCGGTNWQPMPLFERDELLVPPGETAGIWLTIEGRTGFKGSAVQVAVGGERLDLTVEREASWPASVPVPLVFGWSAPYPTRSCWELYRELGINVVNDGLVPRLEAARHGVRLTLHLNDGTVTSEHVKDVVARFRDCGYDYGDWAWSFMDEPGDGVADRWVELAKRMRAIDPRVRIWVNPGETSGSSPKACLKMLPYVDLYCPYCNHFAVAKQVPEYEKLLKREGAKFGTLLGYTTPCFGEKASSAPLDLLGMGDFGISCWLDGWAFFALAHGFTYSNSLWDEANCYLADQCVNVYPGAAFRTISTRNAEAIREAVRRWRKGKASGK